MGYLELRQILAQEIAGSTQEKSSHWKFHTENSVLDDQYRITGIHGFSNRVKKFPGSTWLHTRNLGKLFPWASEILKGPSFVRAIQLCHSQEREIDSCVARHIFTFKLLEKYFEVPLQISCVIGDGQANFISIALAENFSKKLISVNRPEVLISDLELLERTSYINADAIMIAKSVLDIKKFFTNSEYKLLLLSAQKANLLRNLEIELFVNIASFQEMTPDIVTEYFDIISSNNAYLYCCNRVEKVLYGGEVNRFFEFPWKSSTVILDESCKWHQYFYSLRNIRLYKKLPFDGEIWHRIVKF